MNPNIPTLFTNTVNIHIFKSLSVKKKFKIGCVYTLPLSDTRLKQRLHGVRSAAKVRETRTNSIVSPLFAAIEGGKTERGKQILQNNIGLC